VRVGVRRVCVMLSEARASMRIVMHRLCAHAHEARTNLLLHSVGHHSSRRESATGTIAPTPIPVRMRALAKVYKSGANAEHSPKMQKSVPDMSMARRRP